MKVKDVSNHQKLLIVFLTSYSQHFEGQRFIFHSNNFLLLEITIKLAGQEDNLTIKVVVDALLEFKAGYQNKAFRDSNFMYSGRKKNWSS